MYETRLWATPVVAPIHSWPIWKLAKRGWCWQPKRCKEKQTQEQYIYIYIKWRRLQERREGVPTLFRLKLIVEKTNSPILCSARTEIEAMRASRYRIRCGFSWMAHIHTRRHLKAIWWNLQMRMSNSPIISSNKWKTHQRSQLVSGTHVLRAHDTYMEYT